MDSRLSFRILLPCFLAGLLAGPSWGVCGDCNQDGATNVLDALLAAQVGASLTSLGAPAFLDCNVTGTPGPAPAGTVNVLDALLIAQFAAGLPVPLHCDDPVWRLNCGAVDISSLAMPSMGAMPDLSAPGSTRFYSLEGVSAAATSLDVTLDFTAGDDLDLLVGAPGVVPGDTALASYAFTSLGSNPETLRIDALTMPDLAAYVALGQPIAVAVHYRSGLGGSYTLTTGCSTPPPPPMGPSVTLHLEEPSGVPRVDEPVSSGVPFAQGALASFAGCYLENPGGQLVPVQLDTLESWPDGSVQWALMNFQASLAPGASAVYTLRCDGARANPAPPSPITFSPGLVDTGLAQFVFDPAAFDLFSSVTVAGTPVVSSGSGAEARAGGQVYSSRNAPTTVTVVEQGPLALTLEIGGSHRTGGGQRLGNYTCWASFHAGSSAVRLLYRLENEQTMSHPNNFWDLGAAGALWFEDLSLRLGLANAPAAVTFDGDGGLASPGWTTRVAIYQDSSGQGAWNSQNHIDGSYTVQTSFRGYRVLADGATVGSGNEAAGWMEVTTAGGAGATLAIRDFWQNFPSKLEVNGNDVVISLWPDEFAFDHEVQGGEEKTHEILLHFTDDVATAGGRDRARAFQAPLFARADAAQISASKALGDFTPSNPGAYPVHEALCETIHTPRGANPRSAVSQRDVIDEYGWRNWGDMMADHETDGYVIGWGVPISHYNNQYDAAYGSLLSFARTGDRKFLDFGEVYARHTADIDIDHSPGDGIYAGGHFWHTTHDVHALTSAHRTWSVDHQVMYPGQPWLSGGGPGLGHIYVRGLWALYHLEGYYPAREAALEVADFAVGYYNGTGAGARNSRESGNLLLTLIPAYQRTGNQTYYDTMVQCITANGTSFTWSGNGGMYPHGLGEFLRMKTERGEQGDTDYALALTALLDSCDQALGQSLGGIGWPHVHYTVALCLAHRYAPVGHPNKAAYETFAGAVWNAILPAAPDYPSAKPLSYWISMSQTWPYFDQGGQ